ncbi:DUF2798 domain-containing protein [Enterococcus sp. DIV0876]|uniref:DUF2798 domain-containing protein n=1 Tax=Enterococcus sp. DIV0876 TaxID=2774633 RepID=UPI003D3009D5
MPINKKESLIYTTLMCFFMVYFMSVYNLMFQVGVSLEAFQLAWNELPLALCIAFILDWFIVSGPAKGFAFKFLTPDSSTWKKIGLISSMMIAGMVFFMSLFGAIMHGNPAHNLLINWLINIGKNVIVALPLQLFVAGPIIRGIFRGLFPIGTVQEVQTIEE